MGKRLTAMFIAVFVGSWALGANAQPATELLAIDTYRHLVSQESMLEGAIRSGSREKFNRFIVSPTMALRERWGNPLSADRIKYSRCYFALDGFILYSDDRFKAGGQLPPESPSAKDYFDQKALCKKTIKGKV